MYGSEVAYVALVVADVERAAQMFEKDFGLIRRDKVLDGRSIPMLSVGATALALVGIGDPFVDGSNFTGVHHIALAVDDIENAANDVTKRGVALEGDLHADAQQDERRKPQQYVDAGWPELS